MQAACTCVRMHLRTRRRQCATLPPSLNASVRTRAHTPQAPYASTYHMDLRIICIYAPYASMVRRCIWYVRRCTWYVDVYGGRCIICSYAPYASTHHMQLRTICICAPYAATHHMQLCTICSYAPYAAMHHMQLCTCRKQCDRDECSCIKLIAVVRVAIPRSIVCVSERDE